MEDLVLVEDSSACESLIPWMLMVEEETKRYHDCSLLRIVMLFVKRGELLVSLVEGRSLAEEDGDCLKA